MEGTSYDVSWERDEDRGNKLFGPSPPSLPVLRGEYDNFALYPPPSLPPFRVSSRAEAVFDLTLIRFLSDGDSLDTRNRSWQKREGTERKLIIHPRLSFSLSSLCLLSPSEINFLGWETHFVFESKHRNLFIFSKIIEFSKSFEFERIRCNYRWNLIL